MFKQVSNDCELLTGIDNEMDLDDDMVHQLAKETWLDLLQEKGNDAETIVTFIQYLDLIQANAKGFVYDRAAYDDGNIHGVVWQTATMRANFEHFGSYISLDTMKRAINKWLWPYMSIAMYNETRNVCICCEAIMCGERDDAYQFM